MRITEKQFVQTVVELIQENPEYVYDSGQNCFYFPDDRQPGCLFGQALIKLGAEEFIREEESISTILMDLSINNPEIREWADHMQASQDTGVPWGECLEAYPILFMDFPY